MKKMGVPESSIDKRVGHIPGSDTTRDYTRLDDSDANNNYAEAYGKETENEVKDLQPLKCTDCGLVNPGFRDRCLECNSHLDISEIEDVDEKRDELRELVEDVIEEEGLMDDLLERVGNA
ncbi:MAG: hypothetical protein MUP58_00335 [Candidatus Nanohaloarchaeota archaeon QJJ-9]|nr:hypothetical protein [Candidatus Nanohaloarchaeota archaeon QJJ-9]